MDEKNEKNKSSSDDVKFNWPLDIGHDLITSKGFGPLRSLITEYFGYAAKRPTGWNGTWISKRLSSTVYNRDRIWMIEDGNRLICANEISVCCSMYTVCTWQCNTLQIGQGTVMTSVPFPNASRLYRYPKLDKALLLQDISNSSVETAILYGGSLTLEKYPGFKLHCVTCIAISYENNCMYRISLGYNTYLLIKMNLKVEWPPRAAESFSLMDSVGQTPSGRPICAAAYGSIIAVATSDGTVDLLIDNSLAPLAAALDDVSCYRLYARGCQTLHQSGGFLYLHIHEENKDSLLLVYDLRTMRLPTLPKPVQAAKLPTMIGPIAQMAIIDNDRIVLREHPLVLHAID
jgi:hypothetical protein